MKRSPRAHAPLRSRRRGIAPWILIAGLAAGLVALVVVSNLPDSKDDDGAMERPSARHLCELRRHHPDGDLEVRVAVRRVPPVVAARPPARPAGWQAAQAAGLGASPRLVHASVLPAPMPKWTEAARAPEPPPEIRAVGDLTGAFEAVRAAHVALREALRGGDRGEIDAAHKGLELARSELERHRKGR